MSPCASSCTEPDSFDTRAPRAGAGVVVAVLALWIASSSVVCGEEPAPLEGMPVTAPVRGSLGVLQENWLQWDSAFLRGEQSGAEIAISDLLQTASELGLSRLPETADAVLARGIQSAADGGVVRAQWATEMAERLDPQRPEVPFAAAVIARYDGDFLEMFVHQARAYLRMFRVPLFWRLSAENLLLWLLGSVVLTGALFVSLQFAVHGVELIEDLAELASRALSVPIAYLVALVVVILPALVPPAWIALPFYWAILLLRYSRRGERAVLLAVLVVLLAMPFLVSDQTRRVQLELSGPMRAVHNVAEGRLYGSLFRDVEELQESLAEAPAVLHFTADLHETVGQSEFARTVYERLVELEPLNAAAHNNLGVYYLRRRETGKAIEHLERAAAIDPDSVEPYLNLYLLYRDYLAFEEAERVLTRVREVAPERVAEELAAGSGTVHVDQSGFARDDEIRRLLRAAAVPADQTDPMMRMNLGRLAPLSFFLTLGVVLLRLLARYGSAVRVGGPAPGRQWHDRFGRWIPGLRSLVDGRGDLAFLSLFVPVGLLLLPRVNDLGYSQPLGVEPLAIVKWILAGLLLTLYIVGRWLMLRLAER